MGEIYFDYYVIRNIKNGLIIGELYTSEEKANEELEKLAFRDKFKVIKI